MATMQDTYDTVNGLGAHPRAHVFDFQDFKLLSRLCPQAIVGPISGNALPSMCRIVAEESHQLFLL